MEALCCELCVETCKKIKRHNYHVESVQWRSSEMYSSCDERYAKIGKETMNKKWTNCYERQFKGRFMDVYCFLLFG